MHSVQRSVVSLGEPLTSGLTLKQIACLEPTEEHDGDEEENRDHGHDDAEGTTVFMPRVLFTILKRRIHIIHEFKLKIYEIQVEN